MEKKFGSKKTILLVGIMALSVIFSVGFAYANTNAENKALPEKLVSGKKRDTTIEEMLKGKEFRVIESSEPLNIERIEQEINAMNEKKEITLTEEQRLQLYKRGYSFEEIDLALMYANEKQEKDVQKILHEKRDELKVFEEKLEKLKFKKQPSVVIDFETRESLLAQGYSKAEISEAWEQSGRDKQVIKKQLESNKEKLRHSISTREGIKSE